MGTIPKRARRTVTCLAAVLLAGATQSLAQAQDGQHEVFPRLESHRFSPGRIISDPWVRSYVTSNLGLGQAFDISTPPIVIGGDTIPGLSGDLLFTALDIEYQQRIVDWFAFRVGYRIDARLGSELETLLSRGINTVTGFEIGWLARLLESESSMLSLDARVSNKSHSAVDIAGFVEDVIDGVDASIVRERQAIRVAGGLRYAHAFSNLLGVVANWELGLGESVSREGDDEVFYRLGGQLDFDLDAWRSIPLNVALGFETHSYPEAPSDELGNLNTGFLRVGFIARDDFTIGLTLSGSTIPLVDDVKDLTYGSALFDLRYYF